jgi:hypothetical protein
VPCVDDNRQVALPLMCKARYCPILDPTVKIEVQGTVLFIGALPTARHRISVQLEALEGYR